MAVRIVDERTGEEAKVGKFASLTPTEIGLFSGIMDDKKGGWRGCGKKLVFPRQGFKVVADEPAKELKGS